MKLVQVDCPYYHSRLELLPKRLRGFISDKVSADRFYLMFGDTGLAIGGFGVTKDGWIVGVFSLKQGFGHTVISSAIAKAKKISDEIHVFCTGNYLKDRYETYGFKVYRTVAWDDREAPSVWSKAEFGEPDLYFMKLED